MNRILSLDYQKFLLNFYPETDKEQAYAFSRFNELIGQELIANPNLYRYNISRQKHLQVHVAYRVSSDISSLVGDTACLLNRAGEKAGLNKNDPFALLSSKIIPLDIYEAEINKNILAALLKQIPPKA